MKTVNKKTALILAALVLMVVNACSISLARDVKVVASTSWVGAIATAAGASDVDVLAPLDLRHPPEYDFKPGDVKRAIDCNYIVHAGYEAFIKKIVATAGIPDSKVLLVFTDNLPDVLKAETRKLATVFGTLDKQKQWERSLDKAVAEIFDRAADKKLAGKRVVVHKFLAKYAEFMGFKVVGTFGGGEELTPVKMAELISLKPDMIIDNWHNPMGVGIADATRVHRAILINFPGHGGTSTIIDVLKYNAKQLGL